MKEFQHIFVVDDDVYLAEMVRQTLLSEGFAVTVFNDSREVLSSIENIKPDLILLDIKMPGLDGNNLLKIIRPKYDIPVIILTGVTTAESMASSIELGADDYVIKPFHPVELIARIKAKFRRYHLNH
jgi:DNA-binding response OmpR family regulator